MGPIKLSYYYALICMLLFFPRQSSAITVTQTIPQSTNQQQAQKQAADKANQGSQQAMTMALGMLAAGAAMIAAGQAQQPPNAGLISSGIMMLGQGMLGMAGSKAAKDNANQADGNAQSLAGLSASTADITPVDGGAGNPDLKIDPSLLRTGNLGKQFDNFEAATGLSRDNFANGIASGQDPANLLAGVGGLSQSQLQSGIQDAMKKPLNEDEKAKVDSFAASMLGDEMYTSNGGGASPGAHTDMSLADYFKNLNENLPEHDPTKDFLGDYQGFSPDVKRQLAQSGVTDKSLFEMVSIHYQEISPIMLGLDRDKKKEKL